MYEVFFKEKFEVFEKVFENILVVSKIKTQDIKTGGLFFADLRSI